MRSYDIAVIGAGPAGMMASVRAGSLNRSVALIERNASAGRKILLTGKGRCNITNIAPLEEFIDKFGKQGNFLRSAFTAFFNRDLISFFESRGFYLKVERQGRVFPITDSAASVVKVLRDCLANSNIKVLYGLRLLDVKKENGYFGLYSENKGHIQSEKIILATGGASYQATGSGGDGFRIAKRLGHTIIPLRPALVPLKTNERWVSEVQGITLKNVRLNFRCQGRSVKSEVGELLFTHFGVSGPLVLDLSSTVIGMLEKCNKVDLQVDLKPGLNPAQIKKRLLEEIRLSGNKNISNLLKDWLPGRLISSFINLTGINSSKRANQISQGERSAIVNLLKNFALTVTGSLPLEEAMVTCGGISTKEINPRTMESKLVPGLYFAGEIIDVCAPSGGYNLQAAFSTGYLAGEKAAS